MTVRLGNLKELRKYSRVEGCVDVRYVHTYALHVHVIHLVLNYVMGGKTMFKMVTKTTENTAKYNKYVRHIKK